MYSIQKSNVPQISEHFPIRRPTVHSLSCIMQVFLVPLTPYRIANKRHAVRHFISRGLHGSCVTLIQPHIFSHVPSKIKSSGDGGSRLGTKASISNATVSSFRLYPHHSSETSSVGHNSGHNIYARSSPLALLSLLQIEYVGGSWPLRFRWRLKPAPSSSARTDLNNEISTEALSSLRAYANVGMFLLTLRNIRTRVENQQSKTLSQVSAMDDCIKKRFIPPKRRLQRLSCYPADVVDAIMQPVRNLRASSRSSDRDALHHMDNVPTFDERRNSIRPLYRTAKYCSCETHRKRGKSAMNPNSFSVCTGQG